MAAFAVSAERILDHCESARALEMKGLLRAKKLVESVPDISHEKRERLLTTLREISDELNAINANTMEPDFQEATPFMYISCAVDCVVEEIVGYNPPPHIEALRRRICCEMDPELARFCGFM